MAAIVCHGLQSCLESQLVESRTLRLNFPFSKPHTPQPNPIDLSLKTSLWDNEETQKKTESSGWSFLQALSNVSHGSKEALEKEMAYVHPQVKKSSVVMSEKSLELCTEKLGNETGSDIVENSGYGIELLCSSPTSREERRPRNQGCLGGRKMRTQNFPPPLTTIRGSESMRVRTHREDGRLVMEVVRVPPSASCFQAERSHGRLRLCFLKNCSFDHEDKDAVTNEDEGECNCDCESEENEKIEVEEEEDKEAEKEAEAEAEEEGEGGERDACGGDMKREKYERPSRCKEGGDHESNELLINWGEPLWVAIS